MAEPLTIWWVRHGPTHAKTMVGWTDLPADLTDKARLSRLREHLPDAPVISSDLLRARQTADAVAGTRPRFAAMPDLREIHFGAWENRLWRDIDAEDPDRIRAFWDEPGVIRAPDGEGWNDLCARVNGAVDALHGLGQVVAVAHFGVILTQVQRALGVTAKECFAQTIDNLSVTCLRFDGQRWQADTINHCP